MIYCSTHNLASRYGALQLYYKLIIRDDRLPGDILAMQLGNVAGNTATQVSTYTGVCVCVCVREMQITFITRTLISLFGALIEL